MRESVCQRFVSVWGIIVDRMDLWVLADTDRPVYNVFAHLDSILIF